MTAYAMDTHRVVKRLKDVGFSDIQAEAVTDIIRESGAAGLADLVTKADLAAAVAELRAEIAALRAEFKQEIAGLRKEMADAKVDMLKWLVPLLLGQAALIVALVKLI